MQNIDNNTFTNNKIELIKSGKTYFDLLLKLITNAKENIHIQTYIFDDDFTGKLIIEALKIASRNKVKIYILVDGYASQNLSEKLIDDLKKNRYPLSLF